MSKNTETGITIVDFVAPATTSKYDAHVDALIQAGEGKAVAITVPVGVNREGVPLEGSDAGRPDKVAFQKAANAKGYTARIRGSVIEGESVTVTFTLSPKIERKPAAADEAEMLPEHDLTADEVAQSE